MTTALLCQSNRWQQDEVARAALPRLPEVLRAELQESLDRSTAAIDAIHAQVPAIATRTALLARLSTPKLTPFTEKRLTAAGTAAGAVVIDCSEAERVAKTMNIPDGWYPIRLERNGVEV